MRACTRLRAECFEVVFEFFNGHFNPGSSHMSDMLAMYCTDIL